MRTASFHTIDDTLGDHRHRYFGEGHQRTSYATSGFEPTPTGGAATLAVTHEGTWSQKAVGAARPHLSTIDVIVAAVLLAEEHLRATDRGGAGRLARMRLTRVQIRTGATPVEDLEAVPVSITEQSTPTPGTYRFACRLATMFATLTLTEDPGRAAPAYDATAAHYYATHLRDHSQEIRAITATPDTLGSEVTVHRTGPRHAYRGIESAYAGTQSCLDYVLAFAQLAQVLAYHHDDLARANSDTFWLRSLTMSLAPGPEPLCTPQRMTGRITRPRILTLGDTPWRLFRMASEVPSVECSVEVAHSLRHGADR